VQTSLMAGFNKIISFDMGGTSTDVAHYKGEYERTFETEIAGAATKNADDGDSHRRSWWRVDSAI